MNDDLIQDLNESLERAIQPAQEAKERINARIAELEEEKRTLLAHRERADRIEDAAKLRKRAGRKPGQRQRVATPA